MQEHHPRQSRSDAGIPRMQERDINAFRWIGEQGAINTDALQDLLGRQAGGATKEEERLSKTRVRHIVEDRWEPAGMIYSDTILGKKWVWLTKRALHRADLPFASHRPADINLNHIHHSNRVRLDLEAAYENGQWESERMIERSKREWKIRKKERPGTYIINQYRMWHMPDAIWSYRDDDGSDKWTFIEVEVSSKGLKKTAEIMQELGQHGITWYFADLDPRKGVYSILLEALNTLPETFHGQFYIYDLAKLSRQVYPS
jgi:hypothetical protein